METKYEYSDATPLVADLIKDMRNMSKEELEGIKKCIEEDESVTNHKHSKKSANVIHEDYAIFSYIAACANLERFTIN